MTQYPQGPSQQQPRFDSQGFPIKPKKHTARTVLIVIGSVFGALIVIGALAPSQPAKDAATPSTFKTVDTGPSPDPVVTPMDQPTATEGTGCDLNASPEEYADCLDRFVNGTTATPKPAMTKSQEQAIRSAESYLSFTAFSRKGLIRQLSSSAGEGFSKADATYAVDHIKVDWNEQAARSAKSYLAFTSFSRAGLIRQLESSAGEGFTHAQAVYGVNKAGL